MADIFDQIHAAQSSPATGASGDIFDQIHNVRSATSPSSPPAGPQYYDPRTLPEDAEGDGEGAYWDTPKQNAAARAFNLALPPAPKTGPAAPLPKGLEWANGHDVAPRDYVIQALQDPKNPDHSRAIAFGNQPAKPTDYNQVPGMPGGRPPGPAAPLLPSELSAGPPPETVIGYNPRTGRPYHLGSATPGGGGGPLSILDQPILGVQNIIAGTEQAAEPEWKQKAAGGSKIIGGALQVASPVLVGTAVPAMVAAPVATVATVAATEAAQKGTESLLQAAGVAPEYAGFAGDVAGLITGFGGGAYVGKKIYTKLGSPEVKVGGKFEGPKPFAEMTDEELVAHANAIEKDPPRNFDWQKQEIVKEALKRQAGRGVGVTPEGEPTNLPATTTGPAPTAGEPPTTTAPVSTPPPPAGDVFDALAQAAGGKPAEIAKGSSFETEQGTLTVRSLSGDKVLFHRQVGDQKTTGVLPIDQFRALISPVAQPAAAPAQSEIQAPAAPQPQDFLKGQQPSPAGPAATPNAELAPIATAPPPQLPTELPSPVSPAPSPAGFRAIAPAVGPPLSTAGAGAENLAFPQGAPAMPAQFPPEAPPVDYDLLAQQAGGQAATPRNEAQPPATAHDFSSTQVNLPEDVARQITAAAESIPAEQQALDAKPPQPHITALYGLHAEDAEEVRKLLADQPPITVTLGNASVFPADDKRNSDVLKVDVDSDDLHRINALLRQLPHTSDYPDYQPHLTITELQPGQGAQYDGKPVQGVTGQSITLNSIAFSDRSGKQTEIPLGGAAPTAKDQESRPAEPIESAPPIGKTTATAPSSPAVADLQQQYGKAIGRAQGLKDQAKAIAGMNLRKAKLLDDALAAVEEAERIRAQIEAQSPAETQPGPPAAHPEKQVPPVPNTQEQVAAHERTIKPEATRGADAASETRPVRSPNSAAGGGVQILAPHMAAAIRHAIEDWPGAQIGKLDEDIAKAQGRYRDLQSETDTPFEHRARLEQLRSRLKELNDKLDIDKPDQQAAGSDDEGTPPSALQSRVPGSPAEQRPVQVKGEYVDWIDQHTFNFSPEKLVGACKRTTLEMAKAFPELTPQRGTVKLADGTVEPGHWWTVDAHGGVIDPTSRQFNSEPIAYHPEPQSLLARASGTGVQESTTSPLRLADAPTPANLKTPSLADIDAYWSGAKSYPATIDGTPTLWVNNAAFDAISRRISPISLEGGPQHIGGLTLTTGQRQNLIEEARVAAKHPESFDLALAEIGRQVEQVAPRGVSGPFVVVQAGPRFSEPEIQRVLQEELDHARQLRLPQGLFGLPADILYTPLGMRAAQALAIRGYQPPNPNSPFFEHDEAVMAAEVGVRLMHPMLYRELGLTAQEARELATIYVSRLVEDHGSKANEVAERIYATIQALEAQTGGPQPVQGQPAKGSEGVATGRPRGPTEGSGEAISGHEGAGEPAATARAQVADPSTRAGRRRIALPGGKNGPGITYFPPARGEVPVIHGDDLTLALLNDLLGKAYGGVSLTPGGVDDIRKAARTALLKGGLQGKYVDWTKRDLFVMLNALNLPEIRKQGLVFVLGAKQPDELEATLRHEGMHFAQRQVGTRVGSEKYDYEHIDPAWLLTDPLGKKAAEGLVENRRYSPEAYELAAEIGAHLAEGPSGWKAMGLSLPEAERLRRLYRRGLIDRHGYGTIYRQGGFSPILDSFYDQSQPVYAGRGFADAQAQLGQGPELTRQQRASRQSEADAARSLATARSQAVQREGTGERGTGNPEGIRAGVQAGNPEQRVPSDVAGTAERARADRPVPPSPQGLLAARIRLGPERWRALSAEVEKTSPQDILANYETRYSSLVDSLQNEKGMPANAREFAESMASSGEGEVLKDFLADVFTDAAERMPVQRVPERSPTGAAIPGATPGAPPSRPSPTPASANSLEQLTESIQKRGTVAAKPARGRAESIPIRVRVADALDRLKSITGSIFKAYANPRSSVLLPAGSKDVTDYERALGRWSGADNRSALDLYEFRKAGEKAIPDKFIREAITNWIEAGGDDAVLAQRERDSRNNPKAARYAKGYEAAQRLTDEQRAVAREVLAHNDAVLEEMQKAGVLAQGVENYITHLYQNDTAVIDKVRAQMNFDSLQTKPYFTKKRAFPTYFDAEKAGFKPRDKDVFFLVAAHERALREALAARHFIKDIKDGKASDGRPLAMTSWASARQLPTEEGQGSTLIRPNIKKGEEFGDYRTINHPALRGWRWGGEDADGSPIIVQGDMLVHPEVYRHLKNNLTKGAIGSFSFEAGGHVFRPGAAALQVGNAVKHVILSLSRFHETTLETHALEHRTNPWNLVDLDMADPRQRALVDAGLMVAHYEGMDAFSEGLTGAGPLGKIPGIGYYIQAYSDRLFKEKLPQLKMTTGLHALDRNRKRYVSAGYSDEKIAQITAKEMNAAFGGLNYRMMGRNRTLQEVLRLLFMAPDFLEARAKFVTEAFRPQGREQLLAYLLGALTLYTVCRILNELGDKKPHWDKPFAVIYDGKEYSMRSVQEDTWTAVTSPGKFLHNRLSPPSSFLQDFMEGRDRFGAKQTVTDQAANAVRNNVPIPLQPWARKGTDSIAQKIAETICRGIGINVKSEGRNRNSTLSGITEAIRAGNTDQAVELVEEGVTSGRITLEDANAAAKRAAVSPLESGFERLPLDRKAESLAFATDTEKQTLLPLFLKALNNGFAKQPPEMQQKVLHKMMAAGLIDTPRF